MPILKKGEYDIWAMKMEHYLAHTDYPIWEVIQNGNGLVSITTDTQGQIKVLLLRTTEEIIARERERKARTTLLMALPCQIILAKFHKMTDQKRCGMQKSRCGGNDESKKMQKTGRLSTTHSEEDEDNALMAFDNSSDSDNIVNAKQRNKGIFSKVLRKLIAQYDGILSYENEVLQSVFMNKESELEKQPLYDRFVTAGGMHAVPPPMTGNYMPSGPDIEVDYSQFTYGPKHTT
ncbi:hypothetical protein Tco_1282404 [Tanacetum coccineum]